MIKKEKVIAAVNRYFGSELASLPTMDMDGREVIADAKEAFSLLLHNRVITKLIEEIPEEEEGENERLCTVCGKKMIAGYVVDDGAEYFCCPSCMRVKYSKDEYYAMVKSDRAYWTIFEE
ncbi:MAG: hypothetical protein J6Z22_04625 [Lachnospiraceae bacterium]|nr:hypothetical protein [Lachnospiraceae bacterium]